MNYLADRLIFALYFNVSKKVPVIILKEKKKKQKNVRKEKTKSIENRNERLKYI